VDTGALTGGAEASDAGANAALDEAAITDPERVLGGFDETGAERWPRETDAQEGFVEAPEREADDDPGGEPG
jgi:hypothetical protein